ncbi:MAG: hypothetical protein ABIA63_06505 [bacterium]
MKFSCFCMQFVWITAIAFSFQGVKNIWLSNDQWVNTRTHETFVNSSFRLANAENADDETKALAIFNQMLRVYGRGGGGIVEGPRGFEQGVSDVWQNIHNRPNNCCDLWNRLMMEFWQTYKKDFKNKSSKWARKVNARDAKGRTGKGQVHTQCALYWKDNDGKGRYHLIDVHRGFFTYSRDGSHIATMDEIKNDITLMTNPSRLPRNLPYFINVDYPIDWPDRQQYYPGKWDIEDTAGIPGEKWPEPGWPSTYNTEIPISGYNTGFYLRKGESLKRMWSNMGKAPIDSRRADIDPVDLYEDYTRQKYLETGLPKDTGNYRIYKPYLKANGKKTFGNAFHEYVPELAHNKFKDGAKSYSGLVSCSKGSNAPALYAVKRRKPGEVIYEIKSIYGIAESFIDVDYHLRSPGEISVEFSVDSGTTWHEAWRADQVNSGRKSSCIDIGRARWDSNKASTFNMASSMGTKEYDKDGNWKWVFYYKFYGYRYLVRIRINAEKKVNDVAINAIKFRNTHILNMFMLPTLLPGGNMITVEGDDLPEDCAVKVTYVWEENGTEKSQTNYAASLPCSYPVHIEESDTEKIRCKHHVISIIDRKDVPSGHIDEIKQTLYIK